jgi:hypothetical protein
MREAKTSVALYSVSSNVDGARIVRQMGVRSNKAIVGMLASASEPLTKDPQLVAVMLQDSSFLCARICKPVQRGHRFRDSALNRH